MTTPPIPVIKDDELLHAVSSLVRAAESYKKATFMLLNGTTPKHIMDNHFDHLQMCETVIDGWCKQLGIEDD